MASDPATSVDLIGPRRPRWFLSWKLWLAMLFVGLALIPLAICIPTYQRMQAIRYLDEHDASIGFAAGGEWRTEWFGKFGTGMNTVVLINCGAELNDTLLRNVAVLSEVKELFCYSLNHASLTDAGVSALLSLRHLERLTIFGKIEVVGGQDLFTDLIAARPPLIVVWIDMPLSDAALAEMTQIESLEVLGISVHDLTRMRHLKALPNLRSLMLSYDGDFDVNWLSTCPRLQSLHLHGAGALTDDDLRQLASLKTLESLTFQSGPNVDVTEAGIAQLAGLNSLKQIRLPAELITPATVEVFRKMPALEWIGSHEIIEDRELVEAMRLHWRVGEPNSSP